MVDNGRRCGVTARHAPERSDRIGHRERAFTTSPQRFKQRTNSPRSIWTLTHPFKRLTRTILNYQEMSQAVLLRQSLRSNFLCASPSDARRPIRRTSRVNLRPKCAGANQLLVDVGLSVEALSRLNASPPYLFRPCNAVPMKRPTGANSRQRWLLNLAVGPADQST